MSRLRTIAVDLAELLDDSVAPIYVLDDERRIVYCNAACAQWTGLKAADLVGQRCGFHTADEPGAADVAAGLCPPPKVFCGHAQTAMVNCPRADGRLVFRRGHFWPLAEGEDESSPVLAMLELHDCPGPAPAESDGPRKPLSDAQLHEHVRLFRHQMAGRFRADRLIGASPLLVRARAQIALATRTRASVLCVGPPGVGKVHAAKAIHYGQSAPGSLVSVDCAALATNVLRSTLRSAWLRHSAASESAGASLLMQEVDRMDPEAQVDLVQLLRADPLPLRVIATSVRSPAELVAEGRFSPELACALSTVTIELPPLGQRLEDLPLLAQAFLEEVNATSLKQLGSFSSEALDQLTAYPWHGNLDELAQMVRETHERAQGGEVTARDLPEAIRWAADAALHPRRGEEAIVLEEFLARVETELITRALRRSKGNKSKAARLLGLTRPRLYRRLVQLGLEHADAEPRERKK